MSSLVGQAWINLFFFGANFVALLAALTGFVAAWICLFKLKDFLGRDTRQHAKASSVIAYFLVAGVGLSFASFVENSNDTFYQGTGASYPSGTNPITWRAEDAPQIGETDPKLMLSAVIVIGFSFLGSVAFYLALITMFRFDSMHPQHHGSLRDFSMYVFGGVVSTNLAGAFDLASILIPFLSSTAEMLRKAQGQIF